MSNPHRDALLNAADFLDSRRTKAGGNFGIAAQALRGLAFPAIGAAPTPSRVFGEFAAERVRAWIDDEIHEVSQHDPAAGILRNDAVADALRWLRVNLFGMREPATSELRSQLASLQRLAIAGENGEVNAHEACREIAARLPDVLRLADRS